MRIDYLNLAAAFMPDSSGPVDLRSLDEVANENSTKLI